MLFLLIRRLQFIDANLHNLVSTITPRSRLHIYALTDKLKADVRRHGSNRMQDAETAVPPPPHSQLQLNFWHLPITILNTSNNFERKHQTRQHTIPLPPHSWNNSRLTLVVLSANLAISLTANRNDVNSQKTVVGWLYCCHKSKGKVKLFLCLTDHHEDVWGEWRYSSTHT
jgi:hypothetical protein